MKRRARRGREGSEATRGSELRGLEGKGTFFSGACKEVGIDEQDVPMPSDLIASTNVEKLFQLGLKK